MTFVNKKQTPVERRDGLGTTMTIAGPRLREKDD